MCALKYSGHELKNYYSHFHQRLNSITTIFLVFQFQCHLKCMQSLKCMWIMHDCHAIFRFKFFIIFSNCCCFLFDLTHQFYISINNNSFHKKSGKKCSIALLDFFPRPGYKFLTIFVILQKCFTQSMHRDRHRSSLLISVLLYHILEFFFL